MAARMTEGEERVKESRGDTGGRERGRCGKNRGRIFKRICTVGGANFLSDQEGEIGTESIIRAERKKDRQKERQATQIINK